MPNFGQTLNGRKWPYSDPQNGRPQEPQTTWKPQESFAWWDLTVLAWHGQRRLKGFQNVVRIVV